MSAALVKIIIKSITKVIKNTSKFDLAVDDLLEKFKDSCPPKNEILLIVKQKNQIQSALSNVLNTVNTLQKTTETVSKIVKSVDVAVKIIKKIPAPTAVAGVGIPINILTLLADSLDLLGDLIKGAKGALSIIPKAIGTIKTSAQSIISKLSLLDNVLNKCIEELLNRDNMEWVANKIYKTGDNVIYNDLYYKSTIDDNLNAPPPPQSSPKSWVSSTEKDASNQLISEIGNSAASSGEFANSNVNFDVEKLLLDKLSPNSNNPLFYRGFILTLESNSSNTFSFPQRRVVGNRTSTPFTPNEFIIITNLPDGGYSYSTSVQVLIDEVKFRIDGYLSVNPNVDIVQVETFEIGNDLLSPPPLRYPPFGEAGFIGESRRQGNIFYTFLSNDISTLNSNAESISNWKEFKPDTRPFNIIGGLDGDERVEFKRGYKEIYKWSNNLVRWVSDRKEY